ncbi:unnamed protein product [Rangifer tarandus platyrhynchus]|uniref:Uncharacterized protein n=1 Tax=Rangifer tarandus platyrhynchus TaxID=3082113 RepID=A0AC59ZST7_RANTA
MGGKNESFKAGGGQSGKVLGRDPWRSLTLLHFYFWWSQEGPVFLLFLSFRIGLEVSPAVHATISTFLKIFLPLPFSFGFFLSFNLFLLLSLPFMHLFGLSLFPFNFQLSKEFHCQFVYCLFKQLRVILLHICGLSFLL